VKKDGSKLVSKIGKTAYFGAFLKLTIEIGNAYRIRNTGWAGLLPTSIISDVLASKTGFWGH
jgi:hypothetical protein